VPIEATLSEAGERSGRVSGRAAALLHVFALIAGAILVVITVGSDRWRLAPLAVIAVLTIISDLTSVQAPSTKLRLSGSFLGIMLAAVLLGAGPAALVAVLSIAIGWLRSREAPHYLRNNLATFMWFPIIAGAFFHGGLRLTQVGPREPAYYLFVFAAFVFAMALNFAMVAGYQCYLDGSSLIHKTRETLAPILAAELFSALLTVAAVYVAVRSGTIGIALFGLVLVVFQYLIGQLLLSNRRSEDLERMATTDDLTGLANREYFHAVLKQKVAAAEYDGECFAVMLIDLDRFKEINDTLGHHYGDALLSELGTRLGAHVGPSGLVARLGGDEFAVLPGIRTTDPATLEKIAARIVACVQEPFAVDELSLDVGASVGIARYPLDGRSANVLLRLADVAMYAAKAAQSGYQIYAAEHDHNSVRRLSLLSDVRRALAAGEVIVHYQPKVRIDDLSVWGAEALVRWQHPTLGLLPPDSFVPAVEQTGLIGALTRHVLERAIWQCAAWRDAGQDLSIAVNLSARNLLDRGLPREIERILGSCGLPAQALELEITESMIMSDPDRAIAILARLSDLGVRLSVDDFGTGYSSLANLKALPISELKIDRSFVTPMLQDESDLIIVRSTINLGHDLGLTVIAEGVEDEWTLERLAEFRCDLAQGYHISRPLPALQFHDWLIRGGAASRRLPSPGDIPIAPDDGGSRRPAAQPRKRSRWPTPARSI
jgi:diguanylate cyclase (GGDEF)-like protein